jgi:hypothetical protein
MSGLENNKAACQEMATCPEKKPPFLPLHLKKHVSVSLPSKVTIAEVDIPYTATAGAHGIHVVLTNVLLYSAHMAPTWKRARGQEIMQMVPVRGQVHVRPQWEPHIEMTWVDRQGCQAGHDMAKLTI